MKISYNDHADVLYIILAKTHNPCKYVEINAGTIIRIDEKTQMIVGITICDFKYQTENGKVFSASEIDNNLSGKLLLQIA
jgi:uncharacterized protein YuzE